MGMLDIQRWLRPLKTPTNLTGRVAPPELPPELPRTIIVLVVGDYNPGCSTVEYSSISYSTSRSQNYSSDRRCSVFYSLRRPTYCFGLHNESANENRESAIVMWPLLVLIFVANTGNAVQCKACAVLLHQRWNISFTNIVYKFQIEFNLISNYWLWYLIPFSCAHSWCIVNMIHLYALYPIHLLFRVFRLLFKYLPVTASGLSCY